MKRILAASLFLLAGALPVFAQVGPGGLFSGGSTPAPPPPSQVFERLLGGAGGFVIGMGMADDGSRVSYTDISQAYSWRTGIDTQWKPCNTVGSFIGTGLTPYTYNYGPWAMAIAPSASNVMYQLFTPDTGNGSNLRLFKSTDGCSTWSIMSGFGPIATAGIFGLDIAHRNTSQKIGIDPQNPNVVYTCSPAGVFRSVNGTSMSALPTSGTADFIPASGGVPMCNGIQFDRFSGTSMCPGSVSLCTNTIYIPVYGQGIWKSTDAGVTFGQISGTPPVLTMPTITTTQSNAVIMLSLRSCIPSPPTVTVTNDAGLTFAPRIANWTNAGSGNCQWKVRTYWAYAPVNGTVVNIQVHLSAYNSTDNTSARAYVYYGANVAGANPFDTASASISTSTNPALPPTISTVSANSAVITDQMVFGGSPVATDGTWTCIDCTASGYVEFKQFASASLGTPTPTGTTTYRGGWSDTLKATGASSISADNYKFATAPVQAPPAFVWKGQSSRCDGKYYVTDSDGKVYRYDGGTTWFPIPQTGQIWGAVYPHPTICGMLYMPTAGVNSFRWTTYNINLNFGNPLMPDGITTAWMYATQKNATVGGSGITIAQPTDPGYFTPNTIPSTPSPTQMWSLDASDGDWNPATCSPGPCLFEAATGFAYYSAPIVNTPSPYAWTLMAKGQESVVATGIYPQPLASGGNVFFGMADLGGWVNLNTTTWADHTTTIVNNLAGLIGCWDFAHQGLNPANIFAICVEPGGRENSGWSDTNGGVNQSDWQTFGGNLAGNPGLFSSPLNRGPPSYYDHAAISGGALAVNACDANNVIWSTGSGSGYFNGGRLFVTENAKVIGASFTGVIAGTTLTVSAVSGTITAGTGLVYGGMDTQDLYIVSGAGTTWTISQNLGTVTSRGMATGPKWNLLDQSNFAGLSLPASFTGSITGNILTATSISGTISVGSQVTWAGYFPGLSITADNGGGNYLLNTTPTGAPISSRPMQSYSSAGWGGNYQQRLHPVTGDAVTCDTFYAVNSNNNTLYKSSGKGLATTWSAVATNITGTQTGVNRVKLFNVDGKAGWLFATGGQFDGLFNAATQRMGYSTNGGTAWSYCPGVAQITYFGFGAPKPGSGTDFTIYAMGYYDTGGGVYAFSTFLESNDYCQTWTNQIKNSWEPQPSLADQWLQGQTGIAGDFKQYGKVYWGGGPGSGFLSRRLQ